ncbi:WhiB family transcriptional regulator [Nonomuraea sp. NPDC050540]|uniref:WhiB family transcriptional regulator n=1 Tax=Nonomuraea sp. NPDC050540 TaxID=3364367 RepID=UPI00379350AF
MKRTADLRALLDAVLAAGQACGPDTAELFTDRDGESFEDRYAREQQARAICRSCPARAACETYYQAIRPRDGVWAGLSQEDRDSLRAQAVA